MQLIARIESRKTLTRKFGNRGSADGGKEADWCLQRTRPVGDSGKKSQPTGGHMKEHDDFADGWDEIHGDEIPGKDSESRREEPSLQQEC